MTHGVVPHMRKLIYYIACTIDGFIAAEDGTLDAFLTDGDHLGDIVRFFPDTIPGHWRGRLGITTPNQLFDVVLMGRKTYEVGLKEGVTSPYPHLEQYLFSRSLSSSPDPGVTLVRENPLDRVELLKALPGKNIWLCGGAELASALFTAIDEIILKVNPVVLGAGIPLFARGVPQTALEFVDSHSYRNGFMRVRYRVQRPIAAIG
jgi:dihydrofolate reductase